MAAKSLKALHSLSIVMPCLIVRLNDGGQRTDSAKCTSTAKYDLRQSDHNIIRWNQLPNNIRAAGSVAIIKQQLITHLFKDVFIKKLCGYQHLSFDNECNAPLSMFIWKGRNIK